MVGLTARADAPLIDEDCAPIGGTMLSWLIFSVALWRLRREQRRIDRDYLKASRRAKGAEASAEGDEALTVTAFEEYQASRIIDKRIRVLVTRYVLEEADRSCPASSLGRDRAVGPTRANC
jgi:hypothetical protein